VMPFQFNQKLKDVSSIASRSMRSQAPLCTGNQAEQSVKTPRYL